MLHISGGDDVDQLAEAARELVATRFDQANELVERVCLSELTGTSPVSPSSSISERAPIFSRLFVSF